MRRLALAFVLLAACKSSDAPTSSGGSAATGSGSAAAGSGAGSGSAYEALGNKPTNARRPTPPPGIEQKALAVGAQVPTVAVKDSTGAPWSLADALGKQARVMLVFYRGDW